MAETVALVLAAGQGTRMRSRLAKGLHLVGGRPMVARVVEAASGAGVNRVVVVVGFQGDAVRRTLGDGFEYVEQTEQRGTGHAVLTAREHVPAGADVLVLCGDTPLLTSETLRRLLSEHAARGGAATLLTAVVDDPFGYGRVMRGPDGRCAAIVEQADCTPEQATRREINTGIGCYRAASLYSALERIVPDNAQGELYLTDVVGVLCRDGQAVEAIAVDDPEEVLGVNDRRALVTAGEVLRARTVERLLAAGVTVVDPATTYVDDRAEVGEDTTLLPFSVVQGPCRLGRGCHVGPGAYLRDSVLGERAAVWYSVIEQAWLGDGTAVGPYSHVRPGTRLEAGARVGNFAELKNARVGSGTKVPHHSYLGDVEVGAGVNVGAGSVTVNYDGRDKHLTRIADGAFIGCNANLIAPVAVGEGAFVAAGSTVTASVPPGALVISRTRQVVKPGWVERRFGRSPRKEGRPALGGEPARG